MKHSSVNGSPRRWILVVDDEQAIQQMLQSALERPGWDVRTFDGAEQALAGIDSSASPPSLLVCDVIMPRVDGMELTRRVLARVPGIKIVIISGRLSDASWWPADMRDHPFLEKPFALGDLIAAVENILPEYSSTE